MQKASLKHPTCKDIISRSSMKIMALPPGALQRSASSSSFQSRQEQLETNQIQHIKLGFYESRLKASDYAGLCKALKKNKSLTTVEIGFELPRPTLLKILDSVTRLPRLESLALIGLTNLPRRLFHRLVSKSGLRHLELRNVTVGTSSESLLVQKRGLPRRLALGALNPIQRRRTMTRATTTVAPPKTSSSSSRHAYQNASALVNSFADSIQSLRLAACDFEDEDFIHICEWTKRRSQPLDSLGFAYSNSMSPRALETLQSQASCRQLDLTSWKSSSSFEGYADIVP